MKTLTILMLLSYALLIPARSPITKPLVNHGGIPEPCGYSYPCDPGPSGCPKFQKCA